MKFGAKTKLFAAFGAFIIITPLFALLIKVPWRNFFYQLDSLTPIKLSLWTSVVAAGLALLFGVPLAWIFAKSSSRTIAFIRPLVLTPMVLPPTVTGIALLALMGKRGLFGKYIYEVTGWSMPFTSAAVVLTGVFVGLPFIVLICESNFRQLPKEIEDAAIVDRASSGELFRDIALPQSISAISTAGTLAWARAIGEFGATLMFAGSLPGSTQTWTMLIYQRLEISPDSAYAFAALMLIVSVTVVAFLRKPLRNSFR